MKTSEPDVARAISERATKPRRHAPGRCAAALLVIVLGVAGCAPRTAPPAPAVRVVEAPPPPPHHRHRPVPRPERKPAAPQPALNKPTPAAPALQALIGMNQPLTLDRLGAPEAIDSQPPAKVWRYKAGKCELDLYFYLDLRSGQMRTLHYAFTGDADNTAKQQECLRAIAAARAPSLGG